MPFKYECNACKVQSDIGTKTAANEARAEHRAKAHAGLSPKAGDRISHAVQSPKPLLTVIGVLLAFVLIEAITGLMPEDIARGIGLID